MNRLKTLMLLTMLTVLFIFAGQIIGGQRGMVIAFGFAILMNVFSYWFSDKVVLRMYRAKKVTEAEAPNLVRQVRTQAQQAGLPMPKVYIIPTSSPNAFATGRNPKNAVVAFTEGILDLLSSDELDGVIAHELAHVKNRDILIQSIAATVAGAISMLANMAYWGAMFGGYGGRDRNGGGSLIGLLVMAIVAPIAAMFIQMAISRAREFAADATGAKISGQPLSLASALRKLHNGVQRQPLNANRATAHMFIMNPLTRQSFAKLFATHPPVEERIARLENLAYSR
ncbi:MAG: zinc metalloprotease HtpX [candidate division Zixibacteria bacterium]|nr:zinc metalloprotease HtpX [candidate division Zixibacteria bacterium]